MIYLFIGIIALLLLVFLYFDICFIRLRKMEKEITDIFDSLEGNLKKRWNSISNLISVMREDYSNERGVLLDIIKLKNHLFNQKSIYERFQMNDDLSDLINNIDVNKAKNNSNLLGVLDDMGNLEEIISLDRKKYTKYVDNYNRVTKKFPFKFILKMRSFNRKETI